MPSERGEAISAFLADAGWGGVAVVPLAGDASFRRYFRLEDGGRRAVLMDAPPPHEDVRPFAAMGRHLSGLGYSAPAILAEDAETGLLLLEDLGDATYTRCLATGGDEPALYAAAVDLLADLHRAAPPASLAPYDEAAYLREADLLIDWFWPAVDPGANPDAVRAAYHDAWRAVLPEWRANDVVLVLRDYHADNLMWLPDRSGHARVGLLDFQDALAGSPAYDVVSLLEDARRDVRPALADAMIGRYCRAAGCDEEGFRASYAILGAQRNAKIVGIFTRLARRDGKPLYLDLIPRVWRLLEGDLGHPALAPVRAWFDATIPPEKRGRPRP
ncbi:MAG: aminoglycoside phosphotransferase [Rhodospirillaceae bacterium]|nr:aminoglycoside phosphotransferase [Rhodospirillaceae bacterium]